MQPRANIALWFVVAAAASGCRLLGVTPLACRSSDECPGALVCVAGACAQGGVDDAGGGANACGKGGVLADGFDDEPATRLRWTLANPSVDGQVANSALQFDFADAGAEPVNVRATTRHRFELTDGALTFEIEELPSPGALVEIALLPNPGTILALAGLRRTETGVAASIIDADGDLNSSDLDGTYRYWRFRPVGAEIVLEVAGDDRGFEQVLRGAAPARLDALHALVSVQASGGRFALAGVNEGVPTAPFCPASALAGGLAAPVATSPFTPIASTADSCTTSFGDGRASVAMTASPSGGLCALSSWRAYDLRTSRVVVDIASMQAPLGGRITLRAQRDSQSFIEVSVDDVEAFASSLDDDRQNSREDGLDAAAASLELSDDGTALIAIVVDVDGTAKELLNVESPAFLDRVEISFGVALDAVASGASAEFAAVRSE